MNNQPVNTPAWRAFTVASFLVAVTMLGVGINYMPADLWVKGYFSMGCLFAIGATANLTKNVRDEAEARARRDAGNVGIDNRG